jgi:hypothetical protein
MLWKCAFWFFCCTYSFERCTRKRFLNSFPSFYRLLSNVFFFCKSTKNTTQTDTTILSVYSLLLVTIITGHLILTKNSESERFVHFVACERQSDSPRKTSTLRCQMQAQRPTFYIDCRKNIFELFVTKNFFGKKFPPYGRAANKVLTREIFLPVYRVSQKWRTDGALRYRRDYRKC